MVLCFKVVINICYAFNDASSYIVSQLYISYTTEYDFKYNYIKTIFINHIGFVYI